MTQDDNPITPKEQAEYDRRAARDAAKLKAYRRDANAYALRSVLGLESPTPGIDFGEARRKFRRVRSTGHL